MSQNIGFAQESFIVILYIESREVHLGPFLLDVFSDMTVGMLKAKVAVDFGIEVSEQKWVLGNALANDDNSTLSSYGVFPNSYMFLYLSSGHSVKLNRYVMKSRSDDIEITPSCFTLEDMKNGTYVNAHMRPIFDEENKECPLSYWDSLSDSNLELNVSNSPKPSLELKNCKSISSNLEQNLPSMFHHFAKCVDLPSATSKSNFCGPFLPSNHKIFSKRRSLRNILLPLFQKKNSMKDHGLVPSSPRRFSECGTQSTKSEEADNFYFSTKRAGSLHYVDDKNKDLHFLGSSSLSNINDPANCKSAVELKVCLSHKKDRAETYTDIITSVAKSLEQDLGPTIKDAADRIKFPVMLNILDSYGNICDENKVEIFGSKSVENTICSSSQNQQQMEPNTHCEKVSQECIEVPKSNDEVYLVDAELKSSIDICDCDISEYLLGDNENWICEDKGAFSAFISNDKESIVNYQKLITLDSQDLISNCDAFDCSICLLAVEPSAGVVLRDCLHSFCKECLKKLIMYCEETLIKCPFRDEFYSCESHLQQREVKALVSSDLFEKYLRRSIIAAESCSESSFHCRSPDCLGWCLYEKGVNIFHCPICQHYNCLTCKAIHEGQSCIQYQKALKESLIRDKDDEKTQELFNKMLEEGKALKCPKCQSLLMKKWGCDWLKCSICQTEICWVTKGARWGPKGNGDISGGCKCGVNGVKCHPSCTYCH